MSGNTLQGIGINRKVQWERFDRCLREFRHAFAFAPYEYAIPARLKETLAEVYESMLRDRDRGIAEIYGKDHPQIGSRTPERRPRRPR